MPRFTLSRILGPPVGMRQRRETRYTSHHVADSRFFRYSAYLRDRYGARVYRVPVDAGLGCPHRSSELYPCGCRYCGAGAGRASFVNPAASIEDQIEAGISFLSMRYDATEFLLYFQAYSGTHGSVEHLKRLYDAALARADFRELVVSTRPDCIDSSVVALLASYRSPQREVWVELGLQSSREETLRRINRRHGIREFEEAFGLLRDAGLRIAVHVMFGLPGEGLQECLQTVSYLGHFRPDGIKIHNVHVTSDAALAHDFLAGEVSVPSREKHLGYVVEALQLLPADVVVMRLTCDSDSAVRLAPREQIEKQKFYRDVESRLEALGARQGSRYDKE